MQGYGRVAAKCLLLCTSQVCSVVLHTLKRIIQAWSPSWDLPLDGVIDPFSSIENELLLISTQKPSGQELAILGTFPHSLLRLQDTMALWHVLPPP